MVQSEPQTIVLGAVSARSLQSTTRVDQSFEYRPVLNLRHESTNYHVQKILTVVTKLHKKMITNYRNTRPCVRFLVFFEFCIKYRI